MPIFKWVKKFGYLAVLIVVNMVLSFLIEPESGASGRMWAGYYAEEELDTIFVGSSLCQQTFIPPIFDEKLGVKSYNMGTPSQAVPQSIRAIEVAIEEHDIKTVIFGMGFCSIKYEPIPEAELTFESARAREKGGLRGLLATMSYIYSEDVRGGEESVNFLFPWLYNYEDLSKAAMAKNVTLKIQAIKDAIETGEVDKTDGLLKGFRNDDTSVFNYDNKWEDNTFYSYEAYFNAEMLAEFENLLKLCKEKGVDLIVLNTPHPSFDIVSCYEFYEKNQEQLKGFCQKYGVDYYDFGLAKPEIFETRGTYFCDGEHLNRQGAEIFCEQMCDFLSRRASGENMEECFYSIEEFLELHSEELEEWKQKNG